MAGLRRRAEQRRAQTKPKEEPMSDDSVVTRRPRSVLSDDTLRALHNRHLNRESASALAAEAGVSPLALRNGWKRLDLEIIHWGRVRKAGRAGDAEAGPVIEQPDGPPFALADYGYEGGPGREECREPEGIEDAEPLDATDNDAWYERVRLTDSAAGSSAASSMPDDVLDDLFAGEELFTTIVSDPRNLEPIWQRANSRHAIAPTLDEMVMPPVAAIAGWVGRLRALREELLGYGVAIDGKITVSVDL
jgi:hypothetical protein